MAKYINYTCIIGIILGLSTSISCTPNAEKVTSGTDILQLVNPFIGTGGHGHTFPGAVVPRGMVQLSPDTRLEGWDACSGYHISDSVILGFSHTHLSGTGIGDYGDVLFMPTIGEQKTTQGSNASPDSGYASRKKSGSEKASPGYYAVHLEDYDIKAELTTTTRTGLHRYTFPEGKAGVIIDLAHTLQNHANVQNTLEVVSDTEIRGLKMTRGWAREHQVYFYAEFSEPFEAEVMEERGLAKIQFPDNPGELLVKVGISSVDYEGAKQNLINENPAWNFEAVHKQARQDWTDWLSRIQVTGGTNDQQVIFYTALYHAGMAPYTFSDVDGRYLAMDKSIQKSDRTIYTVFSLWDTFRALHPLYTLINSKKNGEMINSLIEKYEEGGVLPMWELAGNYTGTMIGYHAVPVIVDAFMKGQRDFDVEKAYEAIVHSTKYDTVNVSFFDPVIQGNLMPEAKYYNESLGFIPADHENESVSKALEYAYNDWCIAQMAKELGKDDDYARFMERSQRYKQYFDSETGFMRGKLENGGWREPFDPKFSRHRKDDYTEGNAWQWTWFVPHDIEGLTGLFGSQKAFQLKLTQLFTESSEIKGENSSSDISGLIGQYAHGNEPSHHIAYLFSHTGMPAQTQTLVDEILTTLYFNNPNGLSGNEDCGQMSAWFLMSSMGLYQVCPGNPTYTLGRPLFDRVDLKLENGQTLTIKANNNSPENKYVSSVSIDGRSLDQMQVSHSELMEGATITFEMTDQMPGTK